MEKLDAVEKLLAESNKDSVTLIGDGLTKQHFIELDTFITTKGKLYESQVRRGWDDGEEKKIEPSSSPIFSTELNDKIMFDVRSRLASIFESGIERSYMTDRPEKIKDDLLKRGNEYYKEALKFYKEEFYEKALLKLEKAFTFSSRDINYYILKADCFIQLCDFKSAILTINKLLSTIFFNLEEDSPNYKEIKESLYDKIAFCYYMMGQTNFDSQLYMEALESFNKASELRPHNLSFKVKSISCLFSMNRLSESLILMDKIIDENESYKTNCNLYVLRAKLNLKANKISKCFHDLKTALKIDAENPEANLLMEQLEETAEQLRNGALILSLSSRTTDALHKITGAISFNPSKPEYHLQRGILYKRMKDFNSAIDDFLIGLEKINEYEVKDKDLYANFQRQILLTYNDFAIQCYEKRFYDDAIVLLNKAIKIEKKESGFYVNRGDCFYKKNETRFALLDYEQAYEIEPSNEENKERVAKLYYEFGIEKYEAKDYEEATRNFDHAIKLKPEKCKYYISRARTKYMSDDRYSAQKDICISILLEPSNPEIPGIISRLFLNQDLNEVLMSRPMLEAKEYLKYRNIKTAFESIEDGGKTERENKREVRENRLQPSLIEVTQEKIENLKLIQQKRKINEMIKQTVKINFDPNVPRLKPLTASRKKTTDSMNFDFKIS